MTMCFGFILDALPAAPCSMHISGMKKPNELYRIQVSSHTGDSTICLFFNRKQRRRGLENIHFVIILACN
jgi:hypothetical protein